MAALTGLTVGTPDNSYLSLIKFTDNAPLTASLKSLSDGQGNVLGIKLSTTQISIDSPIIFSSLTASKLVYLNGSSILTTIADGSNGQVLTTDGAGGYSFTTVAGGGGITINSTAITSGTAGRILFENASNQVSEAAGLTYSSGLFTVLGTTQQAKFAYDASNHLGITVDSGGGATLLATGASKRILVSHAAVATANYGAVSIGDGYFDGATTGKFVGNAAGTELAMNIVSGSTMDLVNLQVAGASKFKIDKDGTITWGNGSTMSSLGVVNINGGLTSASGDVNAQRFINSADVADKYITGGNMTATSGNRNQYNMLSNFVPTSGTATMAAFAFNGTINQTGGANGITRGLYVNPILTAAADYRAIEVARGTTRLFHTSEQLRIGYNTSNYLAFTVGATGSLTIGLTGTAPRTTFSQGVTMGGTMRLAPYTVGTLPSGVVGDRAYVTDATAPTYLGALTGGGAVTCPVFYNGAAWVSC